MEIPRRADDFIDSIGINTHIDVAQSVYNETVIGQSGIRHFRSNVKPGVMPTLQARLAGLYANYGAKVNLVCDTTDFTPEQYRNLLRDPMFATIEGLNEPDVVGPRYYQGRLDNWLTQSYPATLAFQNDLFNAVSSDPVTASKAVISPAMANPSNSRYLRSAAADFIGMHSYPGQEMPTGNFLTSYAIPGAQLMATPGGASMRIIATETGYRSGNLWGDISLAAATKYVPRLYAEYFRLGVVRTFLFEMTDTNGIYNFGLIDSAFNPKPAYHAVKNLISLVRDSSWDASRKEWNQPAAFNPALLDYTITGGNANVHRVLLQKGDGKVYLLFWQEVPSYDLNARHDISNPTVGIDINFNIAVASGALYRLDSTSPKATYSNVASIHIDVPDEVVVLEFTPGVPVAPTVAPGVPTVSVATTASPSSGAPGTFTVSRAGNSAGAVFVSYAISGSAANGVDYTPLSGGVTIDAGATEATINVNPTSATMVGRKNLVVSLNSNDSYGLGSARNATIYLGNARTVVADFEANINGWAGNSGATTTWDTSNADTGNGALKATFAVNGVDRWINNFRMIFATPQDWSAANTLELRLKESASNPNSDIGKALYFSWTNNGTSIDGGYGAGKIPLSHNTTYGTYTLDLRDLPRNKVTSLHFYVDGAELQVGLHTVYLDNLVAVTATNGVLEDFEQTGRDYWKSGGQSVLQVERLNVDTGSQALKWTFNDTGPRWDNHIQLQFPQPVDLRQYSTLILRFKEDSANPAADIGARLYFDWANNGKRANNDAGVTSFPLKGSGGYRTVELDLTGFARDKVNHLSFYLDGDAFNNGTHTFYLDNLTAY